ncbi:DUF1707 domain-containing protein [Amycolatopsis lurida]|uniref:DUF1707 domain-containing protein n=1 Tax=Amycolatopsis lurida TaxID=31959 RepID=UPI00364E5138
MTWQEELRRLDEELAAGKLTADDYRTRRDQVLSQAVSFEHPQAPQVPGANPAETQIIQPVAPPGQPPQPSADATQVVSASDTGAAERTQVVPPWQPQQQPPQQQHPQQHPGSPAGGFQQPYPQRPGEHSPSGGFAQPAPPPQQQGGWNTPEDQSPPWGGSEFPPLAPSGNDTSWVSQGPESFQIKPSSGSKRKIVIAAIAVVVLAGVGVGVWALLSNTVGDNPTAQQTSSQQQPPPPPSTTPLPEPPAAKPEPSANAAALTDLTGTPRAGGGTFDIAKLKTAKFLPEPMIAQIERAKMTECLLKTNTDGEVTLSLIALDFPDAQGASKVAQEYGNAQLEGGLTADRDLAMRGVPVFLGNSPDSTVYRAVYVLYNRVIIVEAFGPEAQAEQAFRTLLNAQVQKAPPTERNN